MFSCLHCGACCRDLIIEFHGWHVGLFLLPEEISDFPAEMVSPMWAIGTKGRSRPRPDVIFYQLNVKDCPHITEKNACVIYARRPMVCRAHPLSIHTNPYTFKVESATVDSKCSGCKGMPFGQGTYQKLEEWFSNDVLRPNANMTSITNSMFNTPGQQVSLYDVKLRQWKEVTVETVQQWR